MGQADPLHSPGKVDRAVAALDRLSEVRPIWPVIGVQNHAVGEGAVAAQRIAERRAQLQAGGR
ncbi:MAG: hypothetical protein R3D25_17300, partial [Geminicoccaceae bacterium]